MRFMATSIEGACLISLERREDDRGFFARSFCEQEFSEQGLVTRYVQCNVSFNQRRGTLRGMHFQRPPAQEVKIVRCVRGAIYDVIIDLRPQTRTFRKWVAVELNERNRDAFYIPTGCAHGFQTLEDETELWYQMSAFHVPELADGVRWDDKAFDIKWPFPDPILSAKDNSYPSYSG